MTTERKLRWATNFFIWSAAIVLVLEAFPVFARWSRNRHYPQASSLDATAYFIAHMAGGLVVSGGPYILALINGILLHRYKSRIAAALFALFGLYGFGVGMFVSGDIYIAVTLIVFFGAYLTIAVWTFVALTRLHGKWSRPVFVTQLGSYGARLLQRPDKIELEKRADTYYSLIAKAVSQLPLNEPASREKIYDRARAILAEHPSNNLERERRVLDEVIRKFERTAPKAIIANPLHRPSTIWLALSLSFPTFWLLDVTCISLYWVGRHPSPRIDNALTKAFVVIVVLEILMMHAR